MAYVTAMKSDLRNLVSAQEEYFAAHGRYATYPELQSDSLFRSSTGVTVAIEFADAQRWLARATHVAIGGSCTIEASSSADSTSTQADYLSPKCEVQRGWRRCGPNIPLNASVDFWLFAVSVRRRQGKRRRREAELSGPDLEQGATHPIPKRGGILAAHAPLHGVGLESHARRVERGAQAEQLRRIPQHEYTHMRPRR